MTDRRKGESDLLPDPKVCVTRLLVPVGLVECLVGTPQGCPYALAFGDSFFCQHPDCHHFTRSSSTDE
ncbi:MAG: hypothetical protein ACLPT4_01970 [Verrucomicrobiia bacterium]